MNILYYDCFAGISGDMNLAAMLGLGVDPDYLRTELGRLGLHDEWELRVVSDARNGIHGRRVDVLVHEMHGAAHHHGRHLADIRELIDGSLLPDAVRRTSLAIFERLARAEATVHGTTVDHIHFHEVGATDAIIDIVGAAICRHALDIDEVWASPVELGGGFVQCAHGTIPVPAPATVELLQGAPTTRGAVQAETATPTGAAILMELAGRFTANPAMTTRCTAYGIGHRQSELPNVLRVHLAESSQACGRVLPARLLQCNIDDMTAEMLGVVLETLMAAGAMDVHFSPIQMKKNRPATCLSVFCAPQDEERFKRLVFEHTTTLGIKSLAVDKTVLDIAFETADTLLGRVTLKKALLDGRVLRAKPELEDCRELARLHGLSLLEVYRRIGGIVAGVGSDMENDHA